MKFIWLTQRSHAAFWEIMKGTCPEEAARNRNDFQRALTKYTKDAKLQGRVDDIQMRAIEHISEMDKKLWKAFTKRECVRKIKVEGKKGDQGDWVHYCRRHGNKRYCKKEFESWLRWRSY